ncbi:DUF115 domain-containing protein [Paenibacillus thiaminolyticus]|uniref:6-hydroxymethylpterin diphosphokinase MptE-like protein n=1 Tax=Paenibacillus thiaminolyticus TaxID=49283 RepID=UPI00232F31A8|nr:6-hydroxymethylpterin diphosphokinase MptE-like protein [Paenibacillus thiaminolyticus]WCF07932.1 DUF115 domain-containing protein [Paenibacillus thiaminolyticus]
MEALKTNAKVIHDRFPHLASIIDDGTSIPDSVQMVLSKDNRFHPVVQGDGRLHHIYSTYNVEREVSLWLEQVSDSVSESLYVLLTGFGCGYHLEALINRFPGKRYYVYEPDVGLFCKVMQTCDVSAVLSHSSLEDLTVGTDAERNTSFLDRFTDQVSGKFVQLCVPSYQRIYHANIKEFHELAVQVAKMKRSNLATFLQFGPEWITNVLQNMKHIVKSPSVTFLKNKFYDVPAVVVGSGPSLYYDLDMIRQLKGKALIIAAGTSIQALIQADIEPDLVVSMDGGQSNCKAFQSVDTDHIPLIYGTFINPGILNDNRQFCSYFILDLEIITPHLLGDTSEVPIFTSNFSVTGLCIQLAAYMGCRTIVFTGQDLSFPGRKYYADGIRHSDPEYIRITTESASIEVENVYGIMNYTNHIMFVTLRDIENLIGLYTDIKFINTSQHGARIKGTTFIPMDKLEYHLSGSSVHSRVKELFKQKQRTEMTDDVIMRMRSDLSELVALKNSLHQLLKLINRLKNKTKPGQTHFLADGLKRISKLWTDISHNKTYRVYVNFGLSSLMSSSQRFILELNRQPRLDIKFNIIEKYIPTLSRQIIQFIPFIEESITATIRELTQEGSEEAE